MRPRWQRRHALPVSGHVMTSPRLREVHERLVRLGSAPLSDADAAWQDLRSKLPDRPLSWSGRVMAWLRRPAVAIMTTGLLSTGVAHAAGVQPVRGGVDWFLGGVTSVVGAKNEPRVEREARPRPGERPFRHGDGAFEENRRRLAGGVGFESHREQEPVGDRRGGTPAPAGAGSRGDEDRDEPRDDDRDEREDDDERDEREERDDDERDEREERDDDEDRSELHDDEAEEPDDEELEEPDNERTGLERGGDEDERDDLESDAYDEVEPEEDRD